MKKRILWFLLPFIMACRVDRNEGDIYLYNEKYRPQFHFSPKTGWTNDPNGLVYYNGEYHLFYQHYPDSIVWGPMHWGHAVSKDLIRWEHLPIALYPDTLGWIFSGSSVIDNNNTTGLGSKENPALVAIYSYHNEPVRKSGRSDFQTQGMAYSTDNGRTWYKYQGNPVLHNPGQVNFRDPKVSWHAPSGRWIMVLAAGDHLEIYSSPDLKVWSFESKFGQNVGNHEGTWECPDLFPLKDENGVEHWIMLVSTIPGGPNGGTATQYFIGDFNGSVFTPDDSLVRWLDYGRDNYAGVTFNNIPDSDGRRIFIGWMSNWDYANLIPASVWRNAMTLPRTLALFNQGDRYFVKSSPVKELKFIEKERQSLSPNEKVLLKDSLYHIEILMADITDGFMLELSNTENEKVSMGYTSGEFSFYRTNSGRSDFHNEFSGIHRAPCLSGEENVKVDIYVDLSSVEVFINEGEVVFTELAFPSKPYRFFEITRGQEAITASFIYILNSAWKTKP